MARVIWRGVTLDADTAAMLAEAERLAGFAFVLTQGSYSTSVEASAGTHAGGGAFDIRARDLTPRQIAAVVEATRAVGAASWHRKQSEGPWPEHIHGVRADAADLAPAAERQVTAYRHGLSGLASGAKDRHPSADRTMTWARYLAEKEEIVTDDDIRKIAAAVWNWDGIPYNDAEGKPVSKGNPNWRPSSILANVELIARQLYPAMARLGKRLDDLAADLASLRAGK